MRRTVDLRARPGGARPGDERAPAGGARTTGAATKARRPAGSSSPPGRSRRPWPGSAPGAGRRRDDPARPRRCGGSRREPVTAPHPLPGFARSTVDGYAVRAADTYGVSEGLPGYLTVTGAVRMGTEPDVTRRPGLRGRHADRRRAAAGRGRGGDDRVHRRGDAGHDRGGPPGRAGRRHGARRRGRQARARRSSRTGGRSARRTWACSPRPG